jgi:glycosyltransferase involved in cell wall biosynthesis
MKNFMLLGKEYDYIYDFSNTLPINENYGKYMFYCCYPEHKLGDRGKYSKGLWQLYSAPHRFIAWFRKKNFKNSSIDIMCVSQDTANVLEKEFGKKFAVLYPPANIEDMRNKEKGKRGVISLGGLTHEKNQLEQIEISKSFPYTIFQICGNSKRNATYYEGLKKVIGNPDDTSVPNVALIPDPNFEDLKRRLQQSEIFLNSGRNDPFCMALIEGISAGCIPLIHDSGGITEIVQWKSLRYKDLDDAKKKLKWILLRTEKQKAEIRKKVQKDIRKFGEKQFISKLFKLANIK